jgi:hypothetical protein
MSTIYVKASPGLNVPKEGNPRSYINDSEAVAVEGSHYYRKAVIDADLIQLSDDEWLAIQTTQITASKPEADPVSSSKASTKTIASAT